MAALCSDCKAAKKKRLSQDDVALPIDAAAAVPAAVDIDQTVDHWDEIPHFDDDFINHARVTGVSIPSCPELVLLNFG